MSTYICFDLAYNPQQKRFYLIQGVAKFAKNVSYDK